MKAPRTATGNVASARQWNQLRADARYASQLLAHQMLGELKLPTNASNGNTITLTINGSAVTITMVSGTPTNPNDVKIGASGTATAANILAFVWNPGISNTNQVAASTADQQLLSYVGFALPTDSTTIVIYSNNNTDDAPLTSFSASTTISSGSWLSETLKLYIEEGIFYYGSVQVVVTGTVTGTFTAPSANPRIDLLVIGTAGTVSITAGSEAASPSAPSYPYDKLVIAEVYNRVGQTQILDYDNRGTAQGYILKDARPGPTIVFIGNVQQIGTAVIQQSHLANAGTVPTGTVIPFAGPTGTTISGWLECTGTAVSRTTYATLFGVIGTTYGAGDGSTTFNLPDMRGRLPLGAGTGAGDAGTGTGTPTGTALTARTVGVWGGKEEHMPAHTHGIRAGSNSQGSFSAFAAYGNSESTGQTSGSAGDSTAYNTMPPFLVLCYFIKT